MRHWLLALAVGMTLPPQAGGATEPGYFIWFAGSVVSVDRAHGTLRIARGPTETAGAAIETCTLKRASLNRLRRGMEVEAQADTHHHPWRILHLRIFERKHNAKAQLPVNA